MDFKERLCQQVMTFVSRIGLQLEDKVCLAVLQKDSRLAQRFVFIKDVERYISWLCYMNAHNANVYITPCKMFAQAKNRTAQNFLPAQKVFWLDLDNKMTKTSLLLENVFAMLPVPTCLVRSSEGNYQAYWVLAQDQDFGRLTRLMQYLNMVLKLDYTQDITRIMRLAGFRNHKLLPNNTCKNDMCYLVDNIMVAGKSFAIGGQPLVQSDLADLEKRFELNAVFCESGSVASPVAAKDKKQACFTESKSVDGGDARLFALYDEFQKRGYKSKSEVDMAFVCSAIRRGYSEQSIKAILEYFLDLSKHDGDDYIARTYENAVAFVFSR